MRTALIHRTGGPEVLEIVVDAKPPAPGPHQVLLRTLAMTVSGPDVLIRQGRYKWAPPLPLSPGNEMVGVVEALGEQVQDIELGARVLLSSRELPARGGCYTDFRAVPAAAVHVLPAGIDVAQAVALPTYLVAHAMLEGAVTARTRRIFVNGLAGTVGSALTELAKARGLMVIGTVSSQNKAAHAKKKGADEVIVYPHESVLDRVTAITSGEGVDAAFDHVIGPRFVDVIRMLGDFGTAVAYNVHTPMPDNDIFAELRSLSIRSPALRVFNVHTYDHDIPSLRRMTRELVEMLATGTIKPTIGALLPLTEIVQAHELFEQGKTLGKIVLHP